VIREVKLKKIILQLQLYNWKQSERENIRQVQLYIVLLTYF